MVVVGCCRVAAVDSPGESENEFKCGKDDRCRDKDGMIQGRRGTPDPPHDRREIVGRVPHDPGCQVDGDVWAKLISTRDADAWADC